MTSTLEVQDQSPSVQQRVPSTRPIDERWDRSRGIFFENVKRSRDFRWSGGNEIVFADEAERQIKENKETLRDVKAKLDQVSVEIVRREMGVIRNGDVHWEDSPEVDSATHSLVRDGYCDSGRRTSRQYEEPSVKNEHWDDPVLSSASAMPSENATPAGGLVNFKPTTAHQAPRQSWLATLRSFYAGNQNTDTDPPSTDTKPRRRSLTSSLDDDLSLSQDLEKLSIHARETHSESTHAQTDFPSTHDLPPSNDKSFEPSPERDQSDSTSLASSESSQASPSDHIIFPPSEASVSSQEGGSIVTSDNLATDEPAPERVEEMDSPGYLTYKMSPEDYRSAAIASSTTAAAFWTYKLYKNPAGDAPTVHYCINLDAAEKWAKTFLDEPVVGFDLEWEPYTRSSMSAIKRNVSLIQIAADGRIGLFHLAVFNGDGIDDLMPPSLRHILESRNITKVGVNVSGDSSRLRTHLGLKPKGLFELSHLYNVVRFSESEPWRINKKLVSLSKQVQDILLLPLKKDEIRTSAWSKKLNTRQSAYAASDAYAGFQLYHKLEEKRMAMDPRPPQPAFWEENKPLELGNGVVIDSKRYDPRKKRLAELEAQRGTELDDDEYEEYFDTVENIDADPADLASEESSESDLPHVSQPSSQLPWHSDLVGSSEDHEQQPSGLHPRNTQPTQSKNTKRLVPTSPEVRMADLWATSYRASLPVEHTVTGHAKLRAYHMWHRQGLDCPTIAGLLGDPPLTLQTVAGYVMTAVQSENLDFDVERIKEPLELLPKSVHGRYWKVLKRSG